MIHHWKAGVLRFLKTYYTIFLNFIVFYHFPNLREWGWGAKNSKFQNCHTIKCGSSLESWCSEVSENILYNMFTFFCNFLPIYEWVMWHLLTELDKLSSTNMIRTKC